jgi:hypothetical protein
MTHATPRIAAALIARDESRCIARCIESIRPFVDRVVLVDTGSKDDTARLAERCGAQVHHMVWPDDFSVARNHALDLADADWTLVIDADEWIDRGGETVRDWCGGPPRIGAVCVHSSFDLPEGALPGAPPPEGRNWLPRLLPRGVRYEGRIHEQPVSALPIVRVPLHIRHDGYLDAQSAGKRDRNLALLLAEARDNPADPYLLYQLGTEAESRKDHQAAAGWYRQSLALTPEAANWRHAMLVRHLHCLGQSGQTETALDLAEAEIATWQDSPDFFFVLGNLLLDRAMSDPAQALAHWLPLAETAWERCLAIGERPDLEGSINGRGSFLARHNLDMMRGQIATLSA